MTSVTRLSRTVKSIVLMCAVSGVSVDVLGSEGEDVIQLRETVISGNQELPKVLYIVPWQQPNGLPDIEVKHDFTDRDVFRKLYPPAYRRELNYFQSLQAQRLAREGNSENTDKSEN